MLAIIKFGPASWRAWSLSLLVEWSSYTLLQKSKSTMTVIEKDEQQRRSLLLYYYFLRNPLYELATKSVLLVVVGVILVMVP